MHPILRAQFLPVERLHGRWGNRHNVFSKWVHLCMATKRSGKTEEHTMTEKKRKGKVQQTQQAEISKDQTNTFFVEKKNK